MTPEEYINKVKKDRWDRLSGGWLGTFVTEEDALAAVELARNSKVLDALTRDDMKYISELYDQIPYMKEEDFYDEMLRRFKAYKVL